MKFMNNNSKLTTRNDNGFALMLTLWVLAVLSVIALTLSMIVSANVKAASYLEKDVRALYLARGAVNRMIVELSNFNLLDEGDALTEEKLKEPLIWVIDPAEWDATRGDLQELIDKIDMEALDEYILCEARLEDVKLPLNKMTKKILYKIPGFSRVAAESIASAVKAKKDSGGFRSVQELLAIDGITPEIFYGDEETEGLRYFFTTNTDGKVFINGARKEILMAIPGLNKTTVEKIRSRAEGGNPVKDIKELKKIMKSKKRRLEKNKLKKLKKWVSFNPAFYRVKAKAYVNGVTRDVEAVVKVAADQKNAQTSSGADKRISHGELVYMSGG